MKAISLLLLFVFILSACGTPPATIDPSAFATSAVQTAFAEATANAPTNTPMPSDTPEPVATNTPRSTNTPEMSVEDVRQNFLEAVTSDLSSLDDVDSISVTRFNEGALEIELKTRWPLQDLQPDVSWTIVRFIADAIGDFDKDGLDAIADGPFRVALTTYSALGDYRYQSVTDWDTIQKLASKSMSFDEWVAAAEAGFK